PDPTRSITFYSLLAVIWLAGALILLVLTWQVNRRFARHVANSPAISDSELLRLFAKAKTELGIHRSIRLIESGHVQSPAIMGLFQPTLLLPADVRKKFDARELRFIFLHELAHLKRGDVMAQALIALLQIFHWFNPVLWFAFRRMRIDREPATDALVLSRTGESEKERYGLMLIKLLEHFNQRHSLPTLVGILEDKDQFKRRFSMIAKFTRGAYGWSLLGAVVIALLGVACLTKSKAAQIADTVSSTTAAPITKPISDAEAKAQDIAAMVDGHVITLDELREQWIPAKKDLEASVSGKALQERLIELGRRIPVTLIDRQLIIDDFKAQGWFIPKSYVDERINDIIKEEFGGDRASFLKTLEERGSSEEKYRRAIEENAIIGYSRNKFVFDKVWNYFQAHPDDFPGEEKANVTVLEIEGTRAVPPGQTGDFAAEINPQAEEARRELQQLRAGADGATFPMPSGLERRFVGKPLWVTRDDPNAGVPSWWPFTWSDISKLTPGETSDVVVTDFASTSAQGTAENRHAYWILRVNARRQASVTPSAEEKARTQLEAERERLQDAWLAPLRAKAKIQIFDAALTVDPWAKMPAQTAPAPLRSGVFDVPDIPATPTNAASPGPQAPVVPNPGPPSGLGVRIDRATTSGSTSGQLASAPVADRAKIIRKLQTIVFDQVDFEHQDIADVIGQLVRRSKDIDPEKVGISFVLRLDSSSASKPDPQIHRDITLHLRNATLAEIVGNIVQQTKLTYAIEDYAVYLRPPSVDENTLTVRTFLVPVDFLSITLPAPGDAASSDAREMIVTNQLVSLGFEFPSGGSATYLPASDKLVVRNTPQQLDLIAEYMERLRLVQTNLISTLPNASDSKIPSAEMEPATLSVNRPLPDKYAWASASPPLPNPPPSQGINLTGYAELPHGPASPMPSRLNMAIGSDDAATVKSLLDQGSNFNASDVQEALRDGRQEIVRLLWAHGPPYYCSKLAYAISQDEPIDKIRDLIDHGAPVNPPEDTLITPLGLAAQRGNIPVAQLLINHGAELRPKSVTLNPLDAAGAGKQLEMVDFLLKSGAQITKGTVTWTILRSMDAGPKPDKTSTRIMARLIQAGALKGISEDEAAFFLLIACQKENPLILQQLLDAGLNPLSHFSAPSGKGPTALDVFLQDVKQESWSGDINPLLQMMEAAAQKEMISISSDENAIPQGEVTTFDKNVICHFQNDTLTADHLVFNRIAKTIEASGHAKLIDHSNTILGPKITIINYDAKNFKIIVKGPPR
ncbi:MAG TPA: M56 family metallopeptidase, partial [Candidatus Methylacidiphilales bacterium]